MSKEMLTGIQAVPFFARFLDDSMSSHQADESQPPVEEPTPDSTPSCPPSIYTFKFPSDWEDR